MPPTISIAVAGWGDPLRLRWLLNALERQETMDAPEVVVGYRRGAGGIAEVIHGHTLAQDGTLRGIEADGATAGSLRNAAWRATDTASVAFLEPTCRPPAHWRNRAEVAARRAPDAIIQGRVAPDPDEWRAKLASSYITRRHEPPDLMAGVCNAVVPRPVLAELGGFDESLPVGDDLDFVARAVASGVELVPAVELLAYSAVEELWLLDGIREAWRLQHLPALLGRSPELRASLPSRFLYRRSHLWLALAIGAAASGKRTALVATGTAWALDSQRRQPTDARELLRAGLRLPGRACREAAELAALLRGSIRARTPLL